MNILEFKPRYPVTQMQSCSLSTVMQLLEICQIEGVKCAVEIKTEGYLDNFVTIVDEVPRVEYLELDDGDCLTVDMGNTQIGFETTSHFFKDIDGRQIAVAIASETYSAFFLSGLVSRQGIQKAKALVDHEGDGK